MGDRLGTPGAVDFFGFSGLQKSSVSWYAEFKSAEMIIMILVPVFEIHCFARQIHNFYSIWTNSSAFGRYIRVLHFLGDDLFDKEEVEEEIFQLDFLKFYAFGR